MLAETKGQIPNTFIEALRDIKERESIISDREA